MNQNMGDAVGKEMEVAKALAQSPGSFEEGFGATYIKGAEGAWWDAMVGCASPEVQVVDKPLVILKSGLNVCPDHCLELGVGTGVPGDVFMPG